MLNPRLRATDEGAAVNVLTGIMAVVDNVAEVEVVADTDGVGEAEGEVDVEAEAEVDAIGTRLTFVLCLSHIHQLLT